MTPPEALRLLIVDDDPEDRLIMRQTLSGSWLDFEVAEHDGADDGFVADLEAGRYDACLMDFRLGGRTAAEILQGREEIRRCCALIICTTEDPRRHLAEDSWEDAVSFLSKQQLGHAQAVATTIYYAVRQHRLYTELLRSREVVARNERMAAVGSLVGGIAHEFNNANMVLMGGLEVLEMKGCIPLEQMERLTDMREALDRSVSMTRILATLAAPISRTPVPTHLGRKVARMLEVLDRKQSEGGLTFTVDIPDDLVVLMHPSALSHLLLIGLTNSMHAVSRCSTGRIHIAARVEEQAVLLSIDDNGIGLPASELDKVFLPFYSRKGAFDRDQLYPEDIRGAGMGLTLAEHLIAEVGGTIRLRSQEGQGASLLISLPLGTESRDTGSWMRPGIAEGAREAMRGVTLLVVEDDPAQLLTLVELARNRGLEVSGAESLATARRLLAERSFDALLLDWHVGEETGATLLDGFAADAPAAAARPVVFVMSARYHKALELGRHEGRVARILAKPVSMDAFLTMLAEQLQHR